MYQKIFTALRSRWELALTLLAFTLLKIPHLSLAFYWDESWVYAPAIKLMYRHGPSLLPGVIPTDYSRGHPLFFPAAAALWMDVFGPSNFAMHCFSLLISLLLIFALYHVMLSLFGRRAAVISIVLLAANTSFFAASSMVLNDILIALLSFTAIWFYYKEKHLLVAALLAMLFLTKESGLVAGVVIGCDILLRSLARQVRWKSFLLSSLSLAAPLAVLALFFIRQKSVLGWYMYPGHIGAIRTGLYYTGYNIWQTLSALFAEDRAYWFYLILLLVSILAAYRQKKLIYLALFPAVAILYACIFLFSFKDLAYYLSLLVLVALPAYWLFRPGPWLTASQRRFLRLMAAFSLLFCYFCCVNFYETRYAFPAVFTFCFIGVPLLFRFLIARSYRFVYLPLLAAIIAAGIINHSYNGLSMDQYTRIRIHQDIVDYLQNNNYYDTAISTGEANLERVHLQDPGTGFLTSPRLFTQVSTAFTHTTRLAIFDGMEIDPHWGLIRSDTSFRLIHRIQQGNDWAEIYRRK